MRSLQDLLGEAIRSRPHEINEFISEGKHHEYALVWMVQPTALGLRPVACTREDIASFGSGATRSGFPLFASHWTSRKSHEAIIAVCRPEAMLSATVELSGLRARPETPGDSDP